MRGTLALDIFILILAIYVIWLIVQALNMKLLSNILGHLIGLGLLSILIVFQQEVKRFFLMFGNQYRHILKKIDNFLYKLSGTNQIYLPAEEIIKALEYFQKNKIGALIIILRQNDLVNVIDSGVMLNAKVSTELLETIFFKNSPLHDGAVIIRSDTIIAAGCILPVTERKDLPTFLGLRHRAAIGVTENTDAFAVVVSEERGEISYAEYGNIYINIDTKELMQVFKENFLVEPQTSDKQKKVKEQKS